MKKLLALLVSASLICLMTSCGDTKTNTTLTSSKESEITLAQPAETKAAEPEKLAFDDESGYTDMVNYTVPKDGEDIVEIVIKDKGTVRIKLFPELLPKACENFTKLVSDGYYDGLTFHRIIADFMIQGGDPEGTGRGGRCIWGEKFDGGFSKYLYHVKGALAYANSGSTATNGSQFYIVVGEKAKKADVDACNPLFNYTEKAYEAYEEDGGSPWLDGGYTVFGQVFDGMDIVTDICNNTEVNKGDNKPVKPVIIEKASIVKYEDPKGSAGNDEDSGDENSDESDENENEEE